MNLVKLFLSFIVEDFYLEAILFFVEQNIRQNKFLQRYSDFFEVVDSGKKLPEYQQVEGIRVILKLSPLSNPILTSKISSKEYYRYSKAALISPDSSSWQNATNLHSSSMPYMLR